MEQLFIALAGTVELVCELGTVLCILAGVVAAAVAAVRWTARGGRTPQAKRQVWIAFAGWIVLALEFALAADIVATAIAPSWDQIGQLAAIAVIRTVLSYFLTRDLKEFALVDPPAAPAPEPA